MKVNGMNTQEYLMTKNKWSQSTLNMIDWKGMQRVLEVLPIQTRIGRVQLIHHWQNTGDQKMLFAQSDKQNQSDDATTQSLCDEQIKIIGKCPFNCGHPETRMNFMECTSKSAKDKRESLLKNLKQKMEQYQVHESIISNLIWGLQWTKLKETPILVGLDGSKVTDIIVKVMREQTVIGWGNLRRGFISSQWAKIQYIVDNYQRCEQKDWNKLFVKWVTDVSWEMWLHQNNALHGNNHKEGRHKKLDNLKQMVGILFKHADKVKSVEDKDV